MYYREDIIYFIQIIIDKIDVTISNWLHPWHYFIISFSIHVVNILG